jgi:TrpR-related protein YerC/YecD
MEKFKTKHTDNLFKAILSLENEKECSKFFEDICTIKEIQDIAQRLEVARLLKEGRAYNDVAKKTGASTATISRVNKCISYGSGGYELVLKRLSQSEKEDNK